MQKLFNERFGGRILEKSEQYYILEQIVEYGKYSFELEQGRTDSLINQAGQMLSAFAFSTAALYMLMPIVLEEKIGLGYKFVFFWVGLISFFLLISLLLSIRALWRWEYKSMFGIGSFYQHVFNNVGDFQRDDYLFLVEWKDALSEMNTDLENSNERRASAIKWSMISFIFAIFLVLIAVVIAAFILC